MSGQPQLTPTPRPIWAPWRIDYIRGPRDGECFLCAKGQTETPADHVVYRGRTAFVLLNEFPYNAGHLLVAPIRHVADLIHMDTEERNEVMALLVKAQDALTAVMAPQGFNIGFNIGAASGAGLETHIHAHLVPRWTGDTNFMPVLADVRVIPEALEETAKLLREAWD